MADIPIIVIQIVHIDGPLKGEIQEFSDSEILIGRYPECHIQFHKDLRIVSRLHAKIVREGNRFALINKSRNFTYLNGKPIQVEEQAYLKSGDWLMFAQGGPKVSFLMKVEEGRRPEESKKHDEFNFSSQKKQVTAQEKQVPVQQKQVPLVIRYGPTLRQFKNLPITIGKSSNCDFRIDHPSVLDQHIQLFYSEGQYWVKDLTGQNSVLINGQPIDTKAPLNPDNQLALSHHGPTFMFLGGGRLNEISSTKFTF
jgi:pSer/pThr/pTyr-binding forkhead associated (FHA) protein